MTREEAIRELEKALYENDDEEQLISFETLKMALKVLKKEPAPSANDASPKQNYPKKNDNTEKAKCQESVDYQHKYLKLNDVVNSLDGDLEKLTVILKHLSSEYFDYDINFNCFNKSIDLNNLDLTSSEKAAQRLMYEIESVQGFFSIITDYCYSMKKTLDAIEEV